MDCREFRQILEDGERVVDAEAEEHLEECPACRELAEGDRQLVRALGAVDGAATDGGADLSFESLQDEIEEDEGPLDLVGEWPPAVRAAAVAAGALAVAAFVFLAMPRSDLSYYPSVRFWGLAVGFFGISVSAVSVALRPVYRPGISGWLTAGVVGILLGYGVFVGALPPAHTTDWYFSAGLGAQLIPFAANCLAVGSAYALPVLGVGWLALRTSRPLLYPAMLMAAAAGTVGHLGLHFHCPLVQPAHLLLGHATVPLVYTAAVGALVYTLDRGE